MLRLGMQLLQTGPADMVSRRLSRGAMKGESAVRQYVGDMLAVERYILDTADKQARNQDVMDQKEALDIVTKVRDIASRHVNALEEETNRRGGGMSGGLKKSALSVLGAGMERWQAMRSERVSKMLRDHYTVLSLASVSYSMLETTALVFRDNTLAETCARHMKDITPLLTELSEVLPLVTAWEYRDQIDQMADEDISDQVVRDVQEAWSGDTIHTGHPHAEAA